MALHSPLFHWVLSKHSRHCERVGTHHGIGVLHHLHGHLWILLHHLHLLGIEHLKFRWHHCSLLLHHHHHFVGVHTHEGIHLLHLGKHLLLVHHLHSHGVVHRRHTWEIFHLLLEIMLVLWIGLH